MQKLVLKTISSLNLLDFKRELSELVCINGVKVAKP